MTGDTITSATTPFDTSLPRYLDAVHAGDRRSAVAVAMNLLDSGISPEEIITGLLAASQTAIGLGWQEGRWSVALEHRASAITEAVLQTLTDTAMRAPGAIPEGSRGRAVVACTEGEWHVLPGRMASEVLRLRGVDVSFIGPSVPAEELADFLGDDPPTAVAVTCSMPISLPGASRTIGALRGLGMYVLCGGLGFGPQGAWAGAAGADTWAPTFSAGADLLLELLPQTRPSPRLPIGPPEVTAELTLLRRDQATWVEAAVSLALAKWPHLAESDRAVRATREDLGSTLSAVGAATLTADSSLVEQYANWFELVMRAHRLPVWFVASAFELLLAVIPTEGPLLRAMAQAGLDACSPITAPIADG